MGKRDAWLCFLYVKPVISQCFGLRKYYCK